MMPTVYFLFFWMISEPIHELKRYEYTEPHMGTVFHVQFYAESQEKADAAAKATFARVKHLNSLFSDYQNDSELMQLCQKAGTGPVKVSAELYEILHKSNQWSARSDGAFDASVGPLIQLWRKARRTRQLPGESAIKTAKELVDYRAIALLPDGKVELKKPKMRLDLGGIAKGYAADEMQKTLKSHGITSACVAAGGDVCVSNRPPGKPGWVISIAPLEKTGKVTTQLMLENQAVSTAGDLEQYVEIDGVRYSHIVDTKTGLGLTTRMSCTVVASRGVDCDAADTAVCVMGHEKGMKMINQQPGMACLITVKENDSVKQYTSTIWPKLVVQP
jgi:thiamine biosynthesis lipoprotein